jgi:hypothetical protein
MALEPSSHEDVMTDRDKEQEARYALKALSWHGWGSPVGLGIFLVAVALFIVLLRYAWLM